jgi:small GTP-binding protein
MPSSKNIKILLVGNESVGKTSLIRRYINDSFNEGYKATLGFEVSLKNLVIDKKLIILTIWDIGAHPSFESMRTRYYQGALAFFIQIDLTQEATFNSIDNWFKEVNTKCPNIPCILIGNKADLPNQCINLDQLNQKKDEIGAIDAIITSAKTGEGVNESFKILAEAILTRNPD